MYAKRTAHAYSLSQATLLICLPSSYNIPVRKLPLLSQLVCEDTEAGKGHRFGLGTVSAVEAGTHSIAETTSDEREDLTHDFHSVDQGVLFMASAA